MTKIANLKVQAKNLKLAMANMGITLTQSQALEAIAQQYGVENWDTISGMLKKKPAPAREPRLADMPCIPSEIWVEGSGPHSSKCIVQSYAFEALQLLHDELALRAYLEANVEEYDAGLESTAIYLLDDEMDHEFTFNELLGLRYADVGMGNWLLKDGVTYLRFCCDDVWRPEVSVKSDANLVVPDSVKSFKGCKAVRLCSHDGGNWDLHVIVPPHLDPKVISEKFEKEVIRLKQLDRENEDNPAHDEYDAAILRAFAQSLGCVIPEVAETVSENWD